MSEKKRGFLGRLFGGKEKPDGQPDVAAETPSAPERSEQLRDEDTASVTSSVEMDVEPVAAMTTPVEPFGIGSAPELIPDMPPPPVPVGPEEILSTDLADAPEEPSAIDSVTEPEPASAPEQAA